MPVERAIRMFYEGKYKKKYRYANREDAIKWINTEIELVPLDKRHFLYFQVKSAARSRFNSVIGKDEDGTETEYDSVIEAQEKTGIPASTIRNKISEPNRTPKKGYPKTTWRWTNQ